MSYLKANREMVFFVETHYCLETAKVGVRKVVANPNISDISERVGLVDGSEICEVHGRRHYADMISALVTVTSVRVPSSVVAPFGLFVPGWKTRLEPQAKANTRAIINSVFGSGRGI